MSEYNSEDRKGRRVTDSVCPFHDERGDDLDEIKKGLFEEMKPAVNKMTGAQRIFLWGAGIFVSVVTVITLSAFGFIWQQQTENREILTRQYEDNRALLISVDKTFSSYIAAHNQISKDGFRRIEMEEDRNIAQGKAITEHESRLDSHSIKLDDYGNRIEKLELSAP